MTLSREKQTWALYPNSLPAPKETEILWVSTYGSQKTLQKKKTQRAVLPLNSVPKRCFSWKRHSNGITELLWLSCLFWAPLGLDFVTSREAQSQAWIWCWMCRFKFRIHVRITKPGQFLQTYGKGISRHCGTLLLWKWWVKQPIAWLVLQDSQSETWVHASGQSKARVSFWLSQEDGFVCSVSCTLSRINPSIPNVTSEWDFLNYISSKNIDLFYWFF